jgi:hypothetical protein
MTIPGFTAEASLYTKDTLYRQALYGSALGDRSATIYPQQACNVAQFAATYPLLLDCALGWHWCFWPRVFSGSRGPRCEECMDACIDWIMNITQPPWSWTSAAIKANYRACCWPWGELATAWRTSVLRRSLRPPLLSAPQ